MELRNCPKCGGLMRSEQRRLCSDCGFPYRNDGPAACDMPAALEDVCQPPRYVTFITMGRYKGQQVLWRPLLDEGEKTLVISENIVDCKPYSEDWVDGEGFEKSTLRTWLNEELLFDMFNTYERACIDGEVFCLTASQATTLFDNDEERIAFPTAYVALQARKGNLKNAMCWWLADLGNPDCAQFVRHDGQVYPLGMNAEFDIGVRPAVWIKCAGANA